MRNKRRDKTAMQVMMMKMEKKEYKQLQIIVKGMEKR